ncbi:MAG: electron transport complex subunit RsxD [Gammaproteobacteria bacterium RBG_16_57_12]|nr:MAG: electron transport complex subunit RsxD [Gammaproteobacteria bacterium RBG_16_57_12]
MPPIAPSSPHFHSGKSVGATMRTVLYALAPGIAIYIALFGWGVLFNIAIAGGVALLCEIAVLKMRDKNVAHALADYSALLTAVLLALSLPPLAPWWLPALGAMFAIIIAKHLYGGLGYNPFNPAMIGYVVLLISFPKQMIAWPAPEALWQQSLSFGEIWQVVFASHLPAADAITMATPLDTLKTQLRLDKTVAGITGANPLFGALGGTGWEWVNLAFLLGGGWMLYRRIINWHIPVAMLAGLALMAGIFHLIDPERFAGPLFHLFSGAAMLGAFFIATDPITASTTDKGRLVYGCGIGILVYIIRTWGGYPDGVAFAVLLMNLAAPTIDYYTQPRVFGHGRDQ